MGGSKSPTSQSTTSTNLPDWLQPYAKQFIGTYANNAFDYDSAGNFVVKQRDPNLNQTAVGFTPEQTQAIQAMGQITGPAAQFAQQGAQATSDTLSGKYLDPASNPYLAKTYDMAAEQMTNQYKNATAPGIMAASQRFGQGGGSAQQEASMAAMNGLGNNLANLGTQIYGGNYQAERGRQDAATGQVASGINNLYAPWSSYYGLGALQQNQAQTEADVAQGNAAAIAEYPFDLLSGFGGALGQAGSGAGTSMTSNKTKGGGGGMFGK